MRIVGGRLRGRSLRGGGAHGGSLRPTADRAREALFNILAHGELGLPAPLAGARVLDLFAGSGALGIEALSRGARHCVFVDTDPGARALIRTNLEALGLNGQARVYRRDACRLGAARGAPFSLVFLDPPYGSGLESAALESAHTGGWLSPGALAVVETGLRDEATLPAGWAPLADRIYGTSRLRLVRLDG